MSTMVVRAGLRYLNSYDTTFIFEYYRNGLGYSQTETTEYYSFVEDALAAYQTGNKLPLMKSRKYSQAYSSQNAMEDYLYLRIVQKDPFDILYFSPALTTIANLDDGSLSLSPELLYAPVTNWEFRLKSWFFLGGRRHRIRREAERLPRRGPDSLLFLAMGRVG
ncbi:hypothetical protein [Desulfovibrio aminophilus]|uniref:hypothetical protein n=1 Tax=Desulfovibrio aminophilus TaxID=81425 RepID=UPI0004045E5B|nr:hypothetical protein [Desulfovibrio aminophilus]